MNKINAIPFGLILTTALAAHGAVQALESTPEQRAALGMTVYSNGVALIRDERTVELEPGPLALHFAGISELLVPESVNLNSDGAFTITELSYRTPSLSRERLLQERLGEEILLLRDNAATGDEERRRGRLLSVTGSAPLVDFGDHIEAVDAASGWRIAFEEASERLAGQPLLMAQGKTEARGPHSFELTYLSNGLRWQADYVIALAARGDRADLTGWLSVSNETQTDFVDTALQFAVGAPKLGGLQPYLAAASRADAEFSRESVAGYRLYSLNRAATLWSGERRQFLWAQQADTLAMQRYLTRGYALGRPQEPQPMTVELEVVLDGANKALPPGTARVYSPDASGRMQFLGADHVVDTAPGEPLRLRPGAVADVRATRSLTRFEQEEDAFRVSWRVVLRNDTAEAVEVVLEEDMGGAWEMVSSSLPHREAAATVASWTITVPAGSETALNYEALIKQPRRD